MGRKLTSEEIAFLNQDQARLAAALKSFRKGMKVQVIEPRSIWFEFTGTVMDFAGSLALVWFPGYKAGDQWLHRKLLKEG